MTDSQGSCRCEICHKEFMGRDLFPLEVVRPEILEYMRADEPNFHGDGWICAADLAHYRARFTHDFLRQQSGGLSDLEHAVVQSIAEGSLVTHDILVKERQVRLGFGQKMSDRIASWGGSWAFLISFFVFLVAWLLVNFFMTKAFDPYPYIFLNLVLAVITAAQAPIILMSQNRKEDRDRYQSKKDYQVNLKAEIEIRSLHNKIDHLIQQIWLQTKKVDEQKNDRQ